MPYAQLTVHIRCTRTGTWRVGVGDEERTVAEAGSRTAAERAVRERFRGRAGRVLLHDRYDRVHRTDLARLTAAAARVRRSGR
ncbi:hypothetical protein ACVU7I_19450 [Patulibacter sp. S7RM1-6]